MAGARTAGLDIGTHAVRAVELTGSGRNRSVHRYGEVPLPPGAVVDGEVRDAGAVTAAVGALWSEHGFDARKVAVSVGNRRVVVRQLELPWVPPEELAAALAFQAQDLLPIPLEDCVLDHHLVEEYVAESGNRMLRLMLVAADVRMVRDVVDAAQASGLRVTTVDLTAFALLRAVATLTGTADPMSAAAEAAVTEALVDVGSAVTTIVVHTAGRPRFVRILMLGGEDVTEQISESLGIPREEAERCKRERGMRSVESFDQAGTAAAALAASPAVTGILPGTQPEPAAATDPAARAVEYAGSALVDEVRGSLDYYRAQPGSAVPERIVLSGGASRLGNLDSRLSAAARIPVQRLSDLTVVSVPPGPDGEPVRDLPVVPIGLAIRAAS